MCQPAWGTKRSAVSVSQWWIVSWDECQIPCSLWVRALLWRRLVRALFELTETHTRASLPLIVKASYTQYKLKGRSFLGSKTELHPLFCFGACSNYSLQANQTSEIWLNSLFCHDVTSSPHSAVVYLDRQFRGSQKFVLQWNVHKKCYKKVQLKLYFPSFTWKVTLLAVALFWSSQSLLLVGLRLWILRLACSCRFLLSLQIKRRRLFPHC